ncbi:MAG: hypothetical protein IJK60_02500 [Clostridia bacterium]|nr:hypothetical protein [Clostridia bacterium]
MKYTFNRTNFNNFKVYEINKLPARAYFIPYTSKSVLQKTKLAKERSSSDLVTVLSGKWDFAYFRKNTEIPDVIDTSIIKFKPVNVPSTWQRTGYENPVYINCQYEFDNPLPNVPDECSVGIYRKKIELKKEKKYIISFLGVAGGLDLYMNGSFVGYSEGAHNTAEFDLKKYTVDGENEILAVIHKWSNGTFLECQDMFRENGIFRDVLLYEMPDTYINDFCLERKMLKGKWNLDIKVELKGRTTGYILCAELYDGKKLIKSTENKAEAQSVLSFSGLEVESWNAEIPKVYDLYVTLLNKNGEIMSLRNYTGFKKVEIKKNIFFFNGQKIKFKGVNHHDTNPKTGYAMSFKDLENDIKLMKSLNVNAVRTSHYPPDHLFLILCDIYGLYVVDEADIETHGCGCSFYDNIDLISHNPAWEARYIDRVSRMYYRDRNRTCVTMWSLGNEAGGYCNQDACYKFLHKVCPQIPVHYEGVVRGKRFAYDVISEMYTHQNDVEKIGKYKRGDKYTKKPFFLCEYAHAMGVGPGGLEDYWKHLYNYDNLMGGCIWEWADHAVYHANGKLKYTYGGDHGEKRHDGNFCVDGLVYPDRTPHTGAYEMQAVYRPVRASFSDGKLVFTNTNRFRNSSYINAECSVVLNGEKTVRTDIINLDIEPCSEIRIDYPVNIPKTKCDAFINILYKEKDRFIAKEQIVLKNDYICNVPAGKGKAKLNVDDSIITVSFKNGKITFNSKTGFIESFLFGSKELINKKPSFCKGFYPNIFRALLDNDAAQRDNWKKAGYADYKTELSAMSATQKGNKVYVDTEFILVNGSKKIAKGDIVCLVSNSGAVNVSASIMPLTNKTAAKHFPRFGLTLEMPKEYKYIEYYGLGEKENMCDFNAQCITGRYKTDIPSMQEAYIKPQDSGNRTEVKELLVTNRKGNGLKFCFNEKPFSFNARNYCLNTLLNAKHPEDLSDEKTSVINIDGFLRGTGTSSCGPDTLPSYDVDASKGLEFSFTVIPL